MNNDILQLLFKIFDSLELDCGDNSCLFAKNKTGMRTNGGCSCAHNLDKITYRNQKCIGKILQIIKLLKETKNNEY